MASRKPLFMSGEGFSEEMAVSDDITLGGLTMGGNIAMGSNKITGLAAGTASGDAIMFGQAATLGAVTLGTVTMVSGNNITLSGGGEVLGLPGTPTSNDAAASKAYVDSVAQGLDVHPSVHAMSTVAVATLSGLATTVDGILLDTDGYRVLLTAQSPATQNGIWVVHSGAWTRATDLATGASAAGSFTFVEQGTSYADTGWVCTSDAPADIVDTNSLSWTQFAGAGTYTADGGVKLTGNVFSVDLDTNPGLQVVSNKLSAKPDGTRGVAKDASGLYLKIDGTSITFDGSGNLQAATSSTAAAIEDTKTTGEAVSAGDPLYISGSNTVSKGDTTDAKAKVIGVAAASAASSAPVGVIAIGPAPAVLTGATPGTPYYLATGGGLSTSLPGAGKRVIQMGIADTATQLWVAIKDYGKKAA